MKQAILLLAVAFCCFTACTKTSENKILIRIQNNTSTNFKKVTTNEQTFTNVQSSDITSYKTFDKVSDLPFVQLVDVNNDTSFAGQVYIDPPHPYLSNGKYTLQIFEDTSTYYGYNCKYIKN